MTKLSGNQKRKMRSASRLYAVQALFQMEQSDAGLDKVRREFLEFRFGAEQIDGEEMIDGDVDFFARLLEQAVNWQVKIDQMTDRALVAKWPIARIDPTLRALFRVAGAELLEFDTPPKVAIVEYMDVASAFFPEGKEARFVNAVLDHMAREARPEAF
ncbi:MULTISPECIES: transcription antitermination factor NusB [Mameliella]|jgi:N utilization substance protein B|uniref:Transcription antitermination protein NusB n=1 Tax=Mameliella alba TaxID=561184 RepID=A0A0B3RU28_9RHOB|nr:MULTISPECIES: transcription antitermination factor NusB [Mameliella]MBV6636869.1 transcription antitermination factor NusB [Mameliella sp.]MCR9273371.1 transcription antitermination factor NusB [Paracoccaceae bacterium]ODM46158.1 transcription antitermination factor NusB [Ruegeria sp. PBVC088]KHQ54455.1 Transcription antitermination factor NusB [Mameliella alba]MBY6118389.1 transcription antitermination factor NusB [Mameliella alba]